MRSIFFSAMGFCAAVFAQSVVDQYVATESPIAKAGILANIGTSGSMSSGAAAGVVIASPSSTDPNYLYTWVRDSSLVFKCLIDQYTTGEDTTLRTLIDEFLGAESKLQQVTNPSGNVSTGGLGEPKFNIDLTAFTGPWGRPQRDGPALRATALMSYADWLIADGNISFVVSIIWPVVKLDLDYTANYWNQTTFDLWEEVDSSSFFTTAVQHRALRAGAAFASTLGQISAVSAYQTQADNVLCFLQSYWNPSDGYITANTGGGRSGKDANTALASTHTFDPEAGCDATTFQPCSDKALSSLKVYVDSFRSIYGINSGIASDAPVATGRYSEDVYFNGNPWYITTAAVAEQLYDALIVWQQQGEITVTTTSLAFFQQLYPSIQVGTYSSSTIDPSSLATTTFDSLIAAVRSYADGFLAINAKYTPSNGGLSEQYDRNEGTPLSAYDLTWSYASTLTAFAARRGAVPASWGANGLVVPSTCSPYAGPTVQVTFNIYAETQFGENVYITGSINALQNWSPDNALALSYTENFIWTITVTLPANTNFQYKYIRKFNGAITWEADPNNSQTTPASGSYTFNDTWR